MKTEILGIFVMLLMAAINMPFINWQANWWNPMSAGACLGMAIAAIINAIMD